MHSDVSRETGSVSFIVLAYRNPVAELRALFYAFTNGASDAGVRSKCILVSNDDDFDPQLIPEAKVLVGHGNVGFAAGIKIGMMAADSEFVVIANPDSLTSAQDVSKFVSQLIRQSGVLVPILREESGEIAYASYEDWVFSIGRKVATRVSRRFLSKGVMNGLPRWVKICGAFVGMPTVIATKYGPFDDAFFMYGEDRDLTWRLRRDLVPIRLVREVSVTHIGGVSGGGMNRELAIFRADSALRVAYRRYGAFGVYLKELDLMVEALCKRGQARSHALAARRTVVAHWGFPVREAPRLDLTHAGNLLS